MTIIDLEQAKKYVETLQEAKPSPGFPMYYNPRLSIANIHVLIAELQQEVLRLRLRGEKE